MSKTKDDWKLSKVDEILKWQWPEGRAERIKEMVEAIKAANATGWVCDAWSACEEWQTHGLALIELGFDFIKYCPFCGKDKKLDKLT